MGSRLGFGPPLSSVSSQCSDLDGVFRAVFTFDAPHGTVIVQSCADYDLKETLKGAQHLYETGEAHNVQKLHAATTETMLMESQ